MEKYRIVKQKSEATPYILGKFDDFHKCYMFFLKVVKEEQQKVEDFSSCGFYVVNDFYKNKYNLSKFCVKIKIEKRKGKCWHILRLQDI